MLKLEVYHPGWPWPVRIMEFVDYDGGVPEFAVFRPVSRSRTYGGVRRVCATLDKAWAMAHKPLPARVSIYEN